MAASKKLKFIGCEIIYREACRLAASSPHIVDVEFLRKGLHDLETSDMVSAIQNAIDTVDPADEYDAILLGYARCNDGLAGVSAGDIPLVIPRAHDCITFFFGSAGAYRDYFDNHPGTYFMTTGWMERNRFGEDDYSRPAYGQEGVMGKLGLTESYEQLVAKHGRENADFIMQTLGDWKQNYSNLLYLEMNACDETEFITQARTKAEENGWTFEHRKGDWSMLEKLFRGDWDDDFVIVEPHHHIIARNDERIIDSEP